MYRRLLIIILLFTAASAKGQMVNGKISGIVTDSLSTTSLDLATVSVFAKDQTLINYQLTDKNGNFSFSKLPLHQNLRLDVSYVGYKTFQKIFRLDSTQTTQDFRIALSINIEDSNAVVVKSIVPIRMNGDTLEINPAAFKMEKTAVAEELLNQVPGITIWSDGSITVNGRQVPKILVDGKPFLNQTDPTIATQNLPKSAIEKIQVYQEIDRTKEQREDSPQDSILTMNIKLKENKKSGYFGKAGVGYGTDDRYEADATFQLYNKKNSLAIGGGINNVNKGIGALQQSLKNNTFRNLNPNLFNVGSFGRNGIVRNHSLGTIYTHNFVYSENGSRENSISANYTNTGANSMVESNTLQERTTKDFSQFIESSSRNNSNNLGHSAGVNFVKSNNSSKNLNISANSNFNNGTSSSSNFTAVKDSSKALQSTNEVNSNGTTKTSSGSLNLSLNNFSSENPLSRLNLNATIGFSNNNFITNNKSVFDSYTNPDADTSYNRSYNNDQENFNASFNLNYLGLRRLLFRRFNLFGIDMSLLQGLSFDHNKSNALVNDYDSSSEKFLVNTRLTNYNNLQAIRYTPGIALQKSFNKWTPAYSKSFFLSVRFAQNLRKEINSSSFAIRNVDRSFSFFTPSFNVSHNYSARDKFMYNLNLGFNRNFTYPSVDQLYTITDSINIYSIRFGNPDLKNTRTDNINLNFSINKRKPKAKYDMNANLSGMLSYKLNPIADSIINDISGKRLVYLVNAENGINFNFNYSANISRKIRKNSLQLQYSGNANNGRSTNFIDGIASNNRNQNLTHNVNLQYSLKSVVILKLAEVISSYSSSQSGSGLTSYKIKNTSTQFGATYNYSKNVSFNTTVSTNDNSNIATNIILWHAFASYRFLKGKEGELKFSAFDLLKKFQNISTNTNVDGTSSTVTNGLQQYFLLSFSYYPRKFGKKDSGD